MIKSDLQSPITWTGTEIDTIPCLANVSLLMEIQKIVSSHVTSKKCKICDNADKKDKIVTLTMNALATTRSPLPNVWKCKMHFIYLLNLSTKASPKFSWNTFSRTLLLSKRY